MANVSPRRWGTFREEEPLWLSDRNSILMMQNLSRIRSDAPIGGQSTFIVLVVYKWQIKDKRPQRSNVNTMNLKQNSQYLWNIVFSSRSIWVLLELIHRWTQHFSKIDQEKCKIEQICIWNPMTTGLLCNHWFTSSVWNFCCWVADIPLHEMSLSGNEQEEMSAIRRLKQKNKPVSSPVSAWLQQLSFHYNVSKVETELGFR